MISNNYYREYISDIDLLKYRSNWNQANENNIDFIIDKPFGKISSNYTTYLLSEAEYTFVYTDFFNGGLYYYMGEDSMEMVGEQTFKINDITYTQTTKILDGVSYIGNLSLLSSNESNTGENYLVVTYDDGNIMILYKQAYDTNKKNFTLSLFGYFIENKTLSEQYLPKILTLSQLNYTHYGTGIPANIITKPKNGQIYCQLIEPETLIIWLYNGEKWFKTN